MTPNQRKGLAALLAAPSVAAAARAAGVSRETLHRWLRDPAFRVELDRRRDEAFLLALGRVRLLSGRAVEAFRRALRHPSPRVQLRAAKLVLGLAIDSCRDRPG